jgi:hypothetical protein
MANTRNHEFREAKSMRNLFRADLLTLALLAVFATPMAAGPYEDGVSARDRGDFATALRLWHPSAEQGDARAQHDFGVMCGKGAGVRQDNTEAARRYRVAAEQGLAEAQYSLGVLYAEGWRVPRSIRSV